MLHYLRIAVTALSLTACVLLIVLWMRSYTWLDTLVGGRGRGGDSVSIFRGSVFINPGGFTFHLDPNSTSTPYSNLKLLAGGRIRIFNQSGFGDSNYVTTKKGWKFPIWLLVAALVVVAALPWLPWWSRRFSLRTLLIATTLIAVALGTVIYLAR